LKVWTRDVLSEFVRTKLDGDRLIVVSNHERFQHRLVGADAYRAALQMHADERRRIVRMRETVEQKNVDRWAGKCISDLAKLKSPRQQGHRQYPVALPQGAVNQPKFRLARLGVAV